MTDPITGKTAHAVEDVTAPLIVCTLLFTPTTWTWFASEFPRTEWKYFGGTPRNLLERKITSPALASWRGCWDAVTTARRSRAALLVSHDARVTFRCAQSARIQRVSTPHLAWGFNFTALPRGRHRRIMASAFKRVNRFVCYSSMERTVYAEYFDIDPARIDVVLWGVRPPLVDQPDSPLQQGDYICALGGNARDYATLFAAMAKVPEVPLVAVLRRENVAGLTVPPNVRLQVDIPRGHAGNILAFSRFMVLPLVGSEVPCGHVTLVAAMYLKKAMIITNSKGVSDYVEHDVNSLLVPVGDVDGLAARIRELWHAPSRAEQLGTAGYNFASTHCSEEQTVHHVRRILREFDLPV